MKFQSVTGDFPTNPAVNLAIIYYAHRRIGMVWRRPSGFAAIRNGVRLVGFFSTYRMAVAALLAFSGVQAGERDD